MKNVVTGNQGPTFGPKKETKEVKLIKKNLKSPRSKCDEKVAGRCNEKDYRCPR